MPIVEASWQVRYSTELRSRLTPRLDIPLCLLAEVYHLTVPLPCRCKQHYKAIHGRTSHLVESSLFLRWLHHTGRCRFTAGHLPVYIFLGLLDGFPGLLPCGRSVDPRSPPSSCFHICTCSFCVAFFRCCFVLLVAGPVRKPCRVCMRSCGIVEIT
jgi:hypothetical protein